MKTIKQLNGWIDKDQKENNYQADDSFFKITVIRKNEILPMTMMINTRLLIIKG